MPVNDPVPDNNYGAYLMDLRARLDSLRKEFIDATQYEQDSMENENGYHQSKAGYYDTKMAETVAWLADVAKRHTERVRLGNALVQQKGK